MLRRRHVVVALALLLLPSMTASAFEDDTHYILTYVICRTVGFTEEEALYVALCNVAMDDSDSLVAAGSAPGAESGIQAHVDNEWMWHAIAPTDWNKNRLQSTSDILKQKNLLFQIALDKWLNLDLKDDIGLKGDDGVRSWQPSPEQQKERLFWLGVFFHYQQDTWAHRRAVELFGDGDARLGHPKPSADTRKEWESYTTPFGHVVTMDGFSTIHEQDRPPWNPMGALRNLEDGILYARTFLSKLPNPQPNVNPYRQTNIFFTTSPFNPNGPGYRLEIAPWKERRDQAWPRSKPLFNQITLEARSDAGRYLEELIRAQIDLYTVSEAFGKADELTDLKKLLVAFTKVWDKYRDKIKLDGDLATLSTFPITKKERNEYRTRIRIPSSWTSNALVRDMGGWQDVLGFPTKTVDRLDLIPNPPKPNRDLQNVTGPWHTVSKEPPIDPDRATDKSMSSLLDVSAMNPGKPDSSEILAVGSVGTDQMLWRKSSTDAKWEPVPKSISKYGLVIARVMPNGTILGITKDYRLETKASLDPKDEWKVVENSRPGTVSAVTVRLDGMIVGSKLSGGNLGTARLKHVPSQSEKSSPGQGTGVLSEYLLEKDWNFLPNEDVEVRYLAVMPNQTSFLGVTNTGILLYKSRLDSPWGRAPNSNAFGDPGGPTTCLLGSVAFYNGGLLAIRRFTSELLEKTKGEVCWPLYPDPDAQ